MPAMHWDPDKILTESYLAVAPGCAEAQPAYLVINNSEKEATTVELPKAAEVYKLSADGIRATTMKLNGRDLVLGENNELPDLSPVTVEGKLVLEPATMAFVIL